MEYFAIADASKHNRMFIPASKRRGRLQKDESELLHTDDDEIRMRREQKFAEFMQHGYPPEGEG